MKLYGLHTWDGRSNLSSDWNLIQTWDFDILNIFCIVLRVDVTVLGQVL